MPPAPSRRQALAGLAGLAAAPLAPRALAAEAVPPDWRAEWPQTDFSRAAVPLEEIVSGGPPRDAIPPIDDPRFAQADLHEGLAAREPIFVLDVPGHPQRAYPIRYLIWHQVVNDRVGNLPVAVTYCPLCNAAVAFDRRRGGRELSFGTTGKLRRSGVVMYDRETESWWQQFEGEAIVGEMTGERLPVLSGWMRSWAAWRATAPGALVMRAPDSDRPYGSTPYVGYDGGEAPWLYRGEDPPHGIHPLARVVTVDDLSWPLERLAEAGAIEEAGYRLEWSEGQASAHDGARIAEGREVGDVRVLDAATGDPVGHRVVFAFAFHAFRPEGRWMLGK
ncbi:MAG: DUF3179 domain-containing protein [Paracoccaceae bacterium]